MILYNKPKSAFLLDVRDFNIEDIIQAAFKSHLNRMVAESEIRSWRNSLQFMANVLDTRSIPGNSIISIEYNIPRTSNRVDFIISGKNLKFKDTLIIVELKQWNEVYLTSKDAIVSTRYLSGIQEALHPSYQAWSYSALLYGFNEIVYTENIQLNPCAYLHNLVDETVISDEFYGDYLKKAPVFYKNDKIKFRTHIEQFIKYGDPNNTVQRIENGKIRPSKALADSLKSMIKGNSEFILIDSQKEVYEEAISLSARSSPEKKNIMIVHGGPGTGKSVVAINLLVSLTQKGLYTTYVTKNSAPRTVYESKLTGHFKKSAISNFFCGSGSFTSTEENIFDTLIVDEAHRLNEKSGLFGNLGENQIKEIIASGKSIIFFLDEDQRVTLKDIGGEEEILKWAKFYKAEVTVRALSSQFRCSGSNGFINWIDQVLQIKETANISLDHQEYDFRVLDDPNELRDIIFSKNVESNKARLVAGYCWDWVSKKDPQLFDITLPEYGFQMRWNLGSDGMLWIVNRDSVSEVGCIHTCQGLEVDYIGVIIGNDLIVRNGEVIINPSARSKMDKSIQGYKNRMKAAPLKTKKLVDQIIKNTYRTLMTRGMRGCFIFCTDEETREYFKRSIRYYQIYEL